MILLPLLATALAQDTCPPGYTEMEGEIACCPEGYVCLTSLDYELVYDKLEELAAIEESKPTITFEEPLVIITDRSGRVYTNGTGTESIPGTLSWGPMEADLELTPGVTVRKREEPVWGFRLRPKASASYLVLHTDLTDPLKAVDAGVDVDFFYVYRFNLNGYVGARSFGVDVGYDVFPNSGVVVGAHWGWPPTMVVTPSVGWYFGF